MLRRSCLVVAFLAILGLLLVGDPVSAQKGGGGRGGGGGGPKMGGGGPPMSGGPRGGIYPGGVYRGSGYRNFYGGVYFGGPYYYLGGPLYYSSPYYYPYSYIYPTTPSYRYYTDPIPTYSYTPPAPAVVDNRATIQVLLPVADAKILFDGNPTKQTGTERYFHTPELDPSGGPYSYRVRAIWKQGEQEVIQERVVDVTLGKTVVADFR